MGSDFIIQLLEPPAELLRIYDRTRPPTAQPPGVPQIFLDAMEVRQRVFVEEQGVPLEYEVDDDDPRSCHWVIYDGRRAEGPSGQYAKPIGTLRLVPFPHAPHPAPGGRYVDTKLLNPDETAETDRPTQLHDGREPYVKLGRLAVVPEYRGQKVARLLVDTALAWMREHGGYFSSRSDSGDDVPKFAGLVCCHAQTQVVGAWEKSGFQVDEGMGTWWEEGIPHVGMFQRLHIKDANLPSSN